MTERRSREGHPAHATKQRKPVPTGPAFLIPTTSLRGAQRRSNLLISCNVLEIAAQPICNSSGPRTRDSICEICPCRAAPIPETDWLEKLQRFLAISPRARLEAPNEAGDLRFLGIMWSTGINTLCLVRPAGEVLGGVYGAPPTVNKNLSNEQAGLNNQTYVYATQYNGLLFDLICSEGTPVLEKRRRELGITCTK